MSEASGNHQPRRKIVWFDVGASVSFLFVGLLLLGRVLWHIIEHHELMPKTLMSGVLFSSVALMFAVQGLKSKRPSRRRPRGKISKRNRTIQLFLVLVVLSPWSSQAQLGATDEVHLSSSERSFSYLTGDLHSTVTHFSITRDGSATWQLTSKEYVFSNR